MTRIRRVDARTGSGTDLCDRVVALNFGQMLAEGPPREVAADRQVIEAYLGEELDFA